MLKRVQGVAAVLAVALALVPLRARAVDDLIPDVGISWTALVTEAGEKLGVVVVAIVGVWFAFLIVKKGVKWASRIG